MINEPTPGIFENLWDTVNVWLAEASLSGPEKLGISAISLLCDHCPQWSFLFGVYNATDLDSSLLVRLQWN